MHSHVREIYQPLSLKAYGFLTVSLIALSVQEYPYGFPESSNLIGLVYPFGATMELSRFRAAPSARLSRLTFECDWTFPAQC